MLDGFDDDFEVAPRLPRPALTRVHSSAIVDIQAAVVNGEAQKLADALAELRACDYKDTPKQTWADTLERTLLLAQCMVEARFRDALTSVCAHTLLGALTEEEREEFDGSSMRDAVTLFARRCTRWVCGGPADGFVDPDGSIDTLTHHRALQAVLCAGVCVCAYTQANFTGPDFSPEELAGIYPLPYMADLVSAEDAGVDVTVPAWRRTEGETDVRQHGGALNVPAGAAAARAGAEGAAEPGDPAGRPASESLHSEDQALTDPAMSVPRGALRTYALTALQVDGDDAYEHSRLPHFLATGRALLMALTPVSLANSAGVLPPMLDLRNSPFARKLHDVCRPLYLAHWMSGRSALLHQRALVERRPNLGLLADAASGFRAAANVLCPGYAVAFGTEDVFRATLVQGEIAATGLQGDRATLLAKREGDQTEEDAWPFDEPAAEAEPASSAAAAGPPASGSTECTARCLPVYGSDTVLRLLLEWGQAQHFFELTSAAKTCFFLAKRESGLLTLLTGALGRRTKFQQYDVAQLVLRARSVGSHADAAIHEAIDAEKLGAASGRFSAEALRRDGLLHADATSAPAVGRSARSGAAAAGESAVAPAGPTSGVDTGVTSDSKADALVLGGIRAVTLAETDASNELLESIAFRDPSLQGVITEDDKRRDELWYKRGLPTFTVAAASAVPVESGPAEPAALPVEDGPLSILDQCVILGLCLDIKNNSPADGLTQEEMRPYIERVLDTPLDWMVYSTGLLIRCWLEFEQHKTQERAVLQMQALVDQHTNRITPLQASQRVIDSSAPASARLSHVFLTAFPPMWDLKRQCADRYRKLMVVRSALQLYEELQMWDEIIDCYVVLDQTRRAEKLIRQRLAVAPSPRLWCVLGIVTDTDEPFETSWELSRHTYGKAQLSLGRRYVERGDIEKGLRALQTGLAASPQNEKEWFLLGALNMRMRKFPEALSAFGRVVALDPTRADAWANMGSIHLHEREWERGYAALEQALRADRKDWRMWDNFLVACCHTKHYSRALHVMHRLVDMRHADPDKTDGVDEECLGMVVHAVLGSLAEQQREAASAALPTEATPTADSSLPAPAPEVDAGVFSLPPASLDMQSDDEGDAQPAAGAAQHRPEYVDARGMPAARYLPELAKLFGHITSAVTKRAKVWQLYALVQDARGKHAEATDCRQRACRALQTAGWEKDAEAVAALASASSQLVEDYLRTGTSTTLTQAKYQLSSVISRVDAAIVHKDHASVQKLRELLARVEARLGGAA